MQLSIESNYIKFYPPKSQLLKWIGNKQKYAIEITNHFPVDFKKYIEPFLGSGAILATVSPHSGFGSDVFKPLIEIWQKLKSDPGELMKWYELRRNRLKFESKEKVYEDVKASYNANPNGPDFLFLSRACYGGVIRFRKNDGYMSTPCGIHEPISSENFSKRVREWWHRVRNVNFWNMDYKEAFHMAKPGDFIYCDPPYSHTQRILYGAQDFLLEELFNEIEIAKSKDVKVALSIDGNKKSGDYICDVKIPKDLFENDIIIDCGKSMLKRFQMEGKALDKENVEDRLLLTY